MKIFKLICLLLTAGCAGHYDSRYPTSAGWRYVEPGFGQDPVWQRQFTNDQQQIDIEISPAHEH